MARRRGVPVIVAEAELRLGVNPAIWRLPGAALFNRHFMSYPNKCQ